MWRQLISESARKFILDHESADVSELSLRFSKEKSLPFPLGLALEQISCRKKAKEKLPRWYASGQVIYPSQLSVEQCSSELTAAYKTSILKGSMLVDLTGGLGVDSVFFAEKFHEVVHVEKDAHLSEISSYNFQKLGVDNISSVCMAAEDYLEMLQIPVDYFYIDPARRAGNGRVFRLEETLPNVVLLQKKMLQRAKGLLLKASPLLDIQSALRSLSTCDVVFVVSVDNECKELLFLCGQLPVTDTKITAVNIAKDGKRTTLDFYLAEEKTAELQLSAPQKFLYEPNAACMKAGSFKILTHKFPIKKLHAHSHLYTSDVLVEDFPGRSFLILGESKPQKRAILDWVRDGKANVSTRNFPLSAEMLKSKLGLKDGGNKYLFGTTLLNQQRTVLVTEKIRDRP